MTAACSLAGAGIGAAWPFCASAFLEWKYEDTARRWGKRLEALEKWVVEHHGELPDENADGDEGVLGVWVSAQPQRKLLGYMTEAEQAALVELGVPVDKIPGKLTTDAERRANGFDLRPTRKLVFGMALGFLAACGAASLLVGPKAIAWGVMMALFLVCAYTDAKSKHTSWQMWIVLDAAAVLYQAAFNGFGWSGLLGGLAAAAVGSAIFFVSDGLCKLLARRRAKKASQDGKPAPSVTVAPIGFGDYMLIIPILIACGMAGGLSALVVSMVAMLAWAAVGFFRYTVTLKSSFPMAPFLAIGFAAGLIVSAFD